MLNRDNSLLTKMKLHSEYSDELTDRPHWNQNLSLRLAEFGDEKERNPGERAGLDTP